MPLGPRVAEAQVRRRLRRDHDGRRNMAAAAAPASSRSSMLQEEANYVGAAGMFDIGHGMCGPGVLAYGTEEQKQALRTGDAARRRALVPALLRAGRRLRPRRAAHARGARRRRLGRQRPEDLDLGRAVRRLRHPGDAHRPQRAKAQGPDLFLRRHEVARHRGAPDQADVGRLELQRGLLDRRADSGFASASATSAKAGGWRSQR